MYFAEREKLYTPLLREAFEARGLPGEWGCAFARKESAFRADAEVLTGGDLRRGGSFGLCQMSMKTARDELGYVGTPERLKDPKINAGLAAAYCKMLTQRFNTMDLRDIAAAYNSGRKYDACPPSTKTYATDVVAFANFYEVKRG